MRGVAGYASANGSAALLGAQPGAPRGTSFFFQKASGRFYPDFVCKLNDDSFLIVEYKGANGWTDAAVDRAIGGLWARLSGGTCQFVMVKDKQWGEVDGLLC